MHKYFETALKYIGWLAIAGLGIFLAFSYFNIGTSVRDILVMVAIPLMVSMMLGYAVS